MRNGIAGKFFLSCSGNGRSDGFVLKPRQGIRRNPSLSSGILFIVLRYPSVFSKADALVTGQSMAADAGAPYQEDRRHIVF
jgi:hypothetical protein